MALELYCDGAVLDTTPHTAHGTCKSCDDTTDRQTRPAGETVWAFECENCDPAEH